MFEIALIAAVAFLASLLTFFSGFGLGTLLTPVFIYFFPVELAIAMTAVVHFLNNIYKLVITRKHISKAVVLQFGIPAIIAAIIGARLLAYFAGMEELYTYEISEHSFTITWMKLVIGTLLIVFALIDVMPGVFSFSISRKKLFAGGLLSGFFGGLSGHQGALRSAFLIRCNLSKEAFIASGIAIACMIDAGRIIVYYNDLIQTSILENLRVLLLAVFSAFAGAFLGSKLLSRISLRFLHTFVAVMIIGTGLALIAGLL